MKNLFPYQLFFVINFSFCNAQIQWGKYIPVKKFSGVYDTLILNIDGTYYHKYMSEYTELKKYRGNYKTKNNKIFIYNFKGKDDFVLKYKNGKLYTRKGIFRRKIYKLIG